MSSARLEALQAQLHEARRRRIDSLNGAPVHQPRHVPEVAEPNWGGAPPPLARFNNTRGYSGAAAPYAPVGGGSGSGGQLDLRQQATAWSPAASRREVPPPEQLAAVATHPIGSYTPSLHGSTGWAPEPPPPQPPQPYGAGGSGMGATAGLAQCAYCGAMFGSAELLHHVPSCSERGGDGGVAPILGSCQVTSLLVLNS